MKFTFALLSLAAVVSARPQDYGGGPVANSPTTTTAQATPTLGPGQHLIIVSPQSEYMFSPQNITAAVGDTIFFQWPSSGGLAHSVTQSTFANPCTLEPNGFDSGLTPNGDLWTLTITNASTPIWFYCKQTTPVQHCGSGMVGSINANPDAANSFAAFLAKAEALGSSEPAQTASGGLSGVGAMATAAPATNTLVSSPPASGAGRLAVSGGSLLVAVLAAFSLA